MVVNIMLRSWYPHQLKLCQWHPHPVVIMKVWWSERRPEKLSERVCEVKKQWWSGNKWRICHLVKRKHIIHCQSCSIIISLLVDCSILCLSDWIDLHSASYQTCQLTLIEIETTQAFAPSKNQDSEWETSCPNFNKLYIPCHWTKFCKKMPHWFSI